MKPDGGPAFPRDGRENPCIVAPQSGMSLRDYFATAAMQGMAAKERDGTPQERAEVAYLIADAMLAERAK